MTDQILLEQWAVDVCVKVASLRNSLSAALADPHPAANPRREAVAASVNSLLDRAEIQIQPGRRGPVARWRGTSIALAYQSLHAAEVDLVDLMTHEQLMARVPAVVRRAKLVLGPSDPQRLAVDQLLHQTNPTTPAFRAAVQQAMRVGFDATDLMHVRVRNFRNMLFSSAAVIVLLMAGLVGVIAFQPDVMPMCFEPDSGTVCPSGAHHPTGGDVPIVAGLGLLGGALAAAFSIRNVRGTSTPYDVPVAVALLKPPLGAFTAVTSILLLGGDFVPGLSELDNQPQILAYALVFGYAQQLVSRLIDSQASTILNNLPGKDPEGNQPAASGGVVPAQTESAPTDLETPTTPPSAIGRAVKKVRRGDRNSS